MGRFRKRHREKRIWGMPEGNGLPTLIFGFFHQQSVHVAVVNCYHSDYQGDSNHPTKYLRMQMGKPEDNQDPLLGLPGFEETTGAPSPANSPTSTPATLSTSPAVPAAKKARTASTSKTARKPVDSSRATPANEAQPVEHLDKQTFENPRKGNFWTLLPSWGISTGVHVAALLALAAWHIEPIQKELRLLLNLLIN